MPKLVYLCNHCSKTSEQKEVLERHEESCVFNPAVKDCYTCKYRTDAGAPISGFHKECDNKKSEQYGKMLELLDEDFKCEFWRKDEWS